MGSSDSNQKLGLTGLAALVFGMMVGSGIFNIPQNMAVGAGLGAVIIGWCVTALGMLMLVATFKILSDRHPELNEGIYQYAEVGFNRFVGFNVAWGYWLCACFANVAYAVMLSDTFGAFSPRFSAMECRWWFFRRRLYGECFFSSAKDIMRRR